jgi:hypothetical protein
LIGDLGRPFLEGLESTSEMLISVKGV